MEQIIKQIEQAKDLLTKSLNTAMSVMEEMKAAETSVGKFIKRMEVEVLAYPDDTLYRLRDERLRNNLIKYDEDLDKNLDVFIEKVDVESVSFNQEHWSNRDKKAFLVEYKTHGYMLYENKYTNDDFGKTIFLSRLDLIEKVSPLFEKAKIDYVERKEANKIAEKEKLERRLKELAASGPQE